MARRIFVIGSILIAVSATVLLAKYSGRPFAWIGWTWVSCCVVVAVSSRSTVIRVAAMNLAAALFALASFESWLWWAVPPADTRYEGIYQGYYQYDHPVLGYAPRPGIVRKSARKYFGNRLVYDVTYTIGPNGLRVSGAAGDTVPGRKGVVVFGGSFTFGEGVNDEESMPFQLALLGDGLTVYNFGVHGYGPHQMLSALEHGLVPEKTGTVDVAHVIYQYVPHHVNRVAGLTHWDRHGPRYRLGSDGKVVFTGHFDDNPFFAIHRLFDKSSVYSRILGSSRPLRQADIELFVAVVRRAGRLAEHLFPGSSFDVIAWTEKEDDIGVAGLREAGLRVHPVSRIIPDFPESADRYLIKDDGHPNALAHGTIARYIQDRIVKDAW